jgi:phosphoserine phosphatase RsbU/P
LNEVQHLQKLLAAKQNQLSSLLEVTKAVNNNFSRAALLRIFEYVLRVQLKIGKVALFIYYDNWELVVNEENGKGAEGIDVEKDLLKFAVRQDVSNFPGGQFENFEVLLPIVHKKTPLAYLLLGNVNNDDLESRDEKLRFVELLANFTLVSLENKRLFKKQLEQERVGREMELAAQVQSMLIPKVLPKNDHIEAAAFYQPHGSIGGDYYDLISIDDGHVAFCMCDVSGKGLSAGMLMANFQANLRALVYKDFPLDQLVDHLNYKVYETTGGERYITMFLGSYDFASRRLNYINAGHNPPVLVSGGDVQLLNNGSTILGVFDSLPVIEKQSLFVDENSIIITYTDGITELENESGEMFGIDRLIDFSIRNQHLPLDTFRDKLIEALTSFKGENSYNDDFSFLVCRFL